MIWDYIRDFFVQYITGGWTSSGEQCSCYIGNFTNTARDTYEDVYTEGFYLKLGDVINGGTDSQLQYICFGDWLATTLTIICMCLIVAFAIWLVIWVFKAVAHAFLLRK